MDDQLVSKFLEEAKKMLGSEPEIADYIAADLLKIPLSNLPMYYGKSFEQTTIAYQWLDKFLTGVPYQYVSHQAYFFDLTFYVDQNVLIPRPETEELVEWILKNHNTDHLKVLDLGTGSGAIAITLKHYRPNWQVTASDISSEALKIAKFNAKKIKTEIEFIQSDLFKQIKDKYDVIVSNPPYISSFEVNEMDKSVLNYEPYNALFAPNNGLYFYQQISKQVKDFLNQNGELFMEFGHNQKDKINPLFSDGSLTFKKDLGGRDRMLRWIK
ncbi:peptide chain release factor N(5)-glutamine methyltransferase [Xylocopilactobacillus apis]|uniref:Release factor glutamine methyltransferase n=1 Tax=Xylocopilactobacillus apis TaxID=2932183 RepID=A0AAU9DDE8_9LACO|nr:peptide chain release factor N(5)-glutamine methyltransferase [Xylocopilactobacillus apis]BDR56176.1 release factor glutamine methyltransferase [Xylocopilactobacillus apis]